MKICITDATDHTDGTNGAIGIVFCNTSGKRAFGKGCDLFRVPRYDPMAFPHLHGGPAGMCVAHGTGRARFACPFVSRSHIMQVFLTDFAGPPRWQFTSSTFIIGKFSRWTRCACCSTTIIDVSVGHKTFRTFSGSCTVLPHIARLTRGTSSSCKSTCFTI